MDDSATLSHRDIFPFQDLPAELRVQVYEYALIAPGPIVLYPSMDQNATEKKVRAKKRDPTFTLKAAPVYGSHGYVRVITEDPVHQRIVHFHEVCAKNILYLSKSIYSEARPILYDMNAFEAAPRGFPPFMRRIKQAASYITTLHLTSVAPKDDLRELFTAIRLDRLEITLHYRFDYLKPATRMEFFQQKIFRRLARSKNCSCLDKPCCTCIARIVVIRRLWGSKPDRRLEFHGGGAAAFAKGVQELWAK